MNELRDLLIALVTRAQLQHERPVLSQEVLDLAAPSERAQLGHAFGSNANALARQLRAVCGHPDEYGQAIARASTNGRAVWRVTYDAPAPVLRRQRAPARKPQLECR